MCRLITLVDHLPVEAFIGGKKPNPVVIFVGLSARRGTVVLGCSGVGTHQV